MNTKNLDRFLKNHTPSCTIHIFSDGDKRHCSCGRDAAEEELKKMIADNFDYQESFMVDVCCALGLHYELSSQEDVIVKAKLCFNWLKTAYEWFEDHDNISVNSAAYKELEEIFGEK